jgi:hypothetical protein
MPERDDFADLPAIATFSATFYAAMQRAETAERTGSPIARAWRHAASGLRNRLTRRTLTIGIATLVVTGTAMAATVQLVAGLSKPSYDVARYGSSSRPATRST